jgi:hypothetical protein
MVELVEVLDNLRTQLVKFLSGTAVNPPERLLDPVHIKAKLHNFL